MLYKPKQSLRVWFGRFAKVMVDMRFYYNQGDHTFFIKHSSFEKITIVIVYVDDIIVKDDIRMILENNNCDSLWQMLNQTLFFENLFRK